MHPRVPGLKFAERARVADVGSGTGSTAIQREGLDLVDARVLPRHCREREHTHLECWESATTWETVSCSTCNVTRNYLYK